MRKALLTTFLLLFPLKLGGTPEVRTVLVFPFENQSTRADLNWISESFAETLSSSLARHENYVLDRDERKTAYTQLGLAPEAPLTLASEYTVARTLGVEWAIIGNFSVAGDRLTARAQLLDVRDLKLKPALKVTGELTDLLDLQTRLAWRLLATYDQAFTAGKEEDFRRRLPDVRLDAFENYVRGILATEDNGRERFFLESARLDPTDHRAAFALGRLYFDRKDYASSTKWLQKLGKSDAHYFESLFLRGVDEFFLGHYTSGEEAFAALAPQVPLNEVSNNLGVLEARLGRYDDALISFERAYKRDPNDPDFCFNRGAVLWYLKRYKAAATSLEEAVHANEEDSEAHTLLAAVLGKLGDSAGERTQLRWLTDHEVGSTASLSGDVLPQTRLKKNYDGRAFRLLSLTLRNALEERLAQLPPEEHSAVHLSRGKKLLAEGRPSEAEREATESVALVPSDSEARLLLAQTLQAEGKNQEAVRELETSLKLRNTVAAHLCLARVYLSLSKPDLARDQGQAALQLDPENHEAAQLMEQLRASGAASRTTP